LSPAGAPSLLAKPPRALVVFLLVVAAIHLALAGVIPLTEDEAYYRLWAQSLQLGYFDHPPMIAWWIRAGMTIAGDTPLGVRLLPVLSSVLTSLLVFDLAMRLGTSERTAVRAAVWFNASVLVAVGAILAVPDAPNILFWALTLSCLARTSGPGARAWWLAAGLAAGLAALSKYSALFLAPGIGLWLVFKPGGWRTLTSPWPWAAALVACGVFGLNIAWNADHHWVTLAKQFGRLVPTQFAPLNLFWFIAGQEFLFNMYVTWFLGKGVLEAWQAWRTKTNVSADVRLPLATSLPYFAYLIIHALHDRVEAHWPAPTYAALVIVAAVGADNVLEPSYVAGLRWRAAPMGWFASAIILLHILLPATDVGRHDPALTFRGWPQFTARIEAQRRAHNAAWIGTLSYGTTGELAAARDIGAPIVELRERERYPPADASWRADLNRPGLVVDLAERVAAAHLERCFASVVPLQPETRGDAGRPGIAYGVELVSGSPPPNGDCQPRIAPGVRVNSPTAE
jgi:4-amino-4-deoxy-L-arabinose transferase-like glycosyltransferase